jgi:hypothetical protein
MQHADIKQGNDSLPPLPFHARWFGLVLIAVGAGLGLLRFRFGIKVDWLNLPVFAIHATYFKTRQFVWIHTDLTDEVAWVGLLIGTLVVALSRRRDETPALIDLRFRALLIALILEVALLSIAAFTFFGISFVYVLLAIAVSPPLLFLGAFRYLLWRR